MQCNGCDAALSAVIRAVEELLRTKPQVIVAIDGRCGAGKTTLAGLLGQALQATVLHTDDFFLRPEHRTPNRLAEIGGNMDRERLLAEVLLPLQRGDVFAYRPFDCHTLSLKAPVEVAPSAVTVVEGSYSCHPELWDCYDLHIFADITPDEQIKRLARRETPDALRRFSERWIPLEERYFSAFDIEGRCELNIRL